MRHLVTLLKRNEQQCNTVDNIRIQSFEYTGDSRDEKGKVTRGIKHKPFDAAKYIQHSIGLGFPCVPIARNKLTKLDIGGLVLAAWKNQLPMKITLTF